MGYALAVLSALLGSAGQLCMKLGVTSYRAGQLAPGGVQVVAGVILYGVAAAVWLLVLARLPLSAAYPVLALNFVLIQVFGTLFLGEPFTAMKGAGLFMIAAGIWMTMGKGV